MKSERIISLRELDDYQLDGIDPKDYPDMSDAFVSSATWKDTGVELTEDELDRIDHADISEAAMMQAVGS